MVEITESHVAEVGDITVRRALPRRARRTVGAWCFADHMGPVTVTPDHGLDVGPHPHCGLATATWLIAGEVLHRDSLGTEQVIAPGQLNLMTAGHGVSHSEEATGRYAGELQGIQLWIALPEATRDGPAAFEHHADLPGLDLDGGTATVFVGSLGSAASPARHDAPLLGTELDLRSASTLGLDPTYEHGIVVLDGSIAVEGTALAPGHLGFLEPGRDELSIEVAEPTRAILLGGEPFPEKPFLWWNFVARNRAEVEVARREWAEDSGRFGTVASTLPRTPAPELT